MSERHLRERLADLPAPDERGAEERAWMVVRAALAQREPVRPRDVRPRLAFAVAAAVALLVFALTPPGDAVGDWIRDVVRPGRTDVKPALTSLPARGRVLVTSRQGAWIVRNDGSKRLLGRYEEATWSPHGLFVAATRGRQLVALDPRGHVRWSLARSKRVSGVEWAPSGFRIAYLAGHSLRVVAGDGTGDRLFDRSVAAAAPAWRPVGLHVLAYSDPAGRVRVVATDSGRRLWTSPPAEAPTQLAWSSDGRRLVALDDRSLRVFDRRGRLLQTLQTDGRKLAFAPTGHGFALARSHEIVALRAERRTGAGGRLFVGAGSFGDLAWSPDGRWLLVAWPSADQWLFLRAPRARKVLAVSAISRQFDPGGGGPSEPPGVSGWCCSP
jgi:WD40 repeat protein